MKKFFSLILSLAVISASLSYSSSVLTLADTVGTTYYVDSIDGSDDNAGTSESAALKTLSKAQSITLSAGDKILLKRGSIFNNESILIKGSGTAENPIVLGAYGEGNMPVINACGAKYGVKVYEANYVTVENLEITNYTETAEEHYGIYVAKSGIYSFSTGIKILNNYIHDIKNENEYAGGIYVRGDAYTTDFNNILIENNKLYNVDSDGIYLNGGYNKTNSKTNGFGENNIVRNNYLENIGFDGILIHSCNGTLVEYNVVNRSHCISKAAEVAIWSFSSDNTLFQFNEAYNTQTNIDGQGFDCDYMCDGTVFQYNYGHHNQGGGMLICCASSFVNNGTTQQAYNDNSVVRYNIFQNNSSRQFHLGGHCKNTQIYNNTIVTSWATNSVAIAFIDSPVKVYFNKYTDKNGEKQLDAPDNTLFANNLFYDFSSYATGSYYSKYSFYQGVKGDITNCFTNTTWENNLVYGRYAYQAPNATNTPKEYTYEGTDTSETYTVVKSMTENITSDPMLVDPFTTVYGIENCDGFKLIEGSPAIGSGRIVENNGGRDFYGNFVSSTEAPNIGAYQGTGVKFEDSGNKLYFSDENGSVYKSIVDFENDSCGTNTLSTKVSNVSYAYTGTKNSSSQDIGVSTCSDTTKLFSASGSKKGAVISRTSSVNADVDFSLISSDINKSQGMRIYANGDGISQSVHIRFGNFGGNKYYYYSTSIPANGGFITIKPGIKVYNNGVDGKYGNETLTLETYRSKISTFRIHFTTKADATAYIDDIQLDMTGYVPEASNVYTIENIDTTPGALVNESIPKTDTPEPEPDDKMYTVTIDGKEYKAKSGEIFTLPQNTDSRFIAYTNGSNYYNSADSLKITENISLTSIYLTADMLSGASIRIKPSAGLRFYMDTDLDLIDSLIEGGINVEMGTLIAPKDLLGTDELTHNLDNSQVTRFVDVKYSASRKYYQENGKSYIVGSIVDIKESNINREFVGRGYIRITIGSSTKTVYASYYNDSIKNSSRSIAYIAKMFSQSEEYNIWPEEYRSVIDYYALKYTSPKDPCKDDIF